MVKSFKPAYTEDELNDLVAQTAPRRGWDFSQMHTLRQPVPWNFPDVAAAYLKAGDMVLDIGAGGGERFLSLAHLFDRGVGIDIDPDMIAIAQENGRTRPNVEFRLDDHLLGRTREQFDVILCRHAPYDSRTVLDHLRSGGYFLVQDVGERNMANVKAILGQDTTTATFDRGALVREGLRIIASMEYDVEYVVEDVESLVFWLQALDLHHADIAGSSLTGDVHAFNRLLDGQVDERGFVTNEHRYMLIGQR